MTIEKQALCDMLVANAAKDALRYIQQQKFLEAQIKTLISAIRTASDLESLRQVANETVKRLRERTRELERRLLAESRAPRAKI